MDIAAEAVADIIAPPPRPGAAARSAGADVDDGGEPSFGDLVHAATDSGDTRKDAKAQSAKAPKPDDAPEMAAELAASLAPSAAPAPQVAPALADAISQLQASANAPTAPVAEDAQTQASTKSAKDDAALPAHSMDALGADAALAPPQAPRIDAPAPAPVVATVAPAASVAVAPAPIIAAEPDTAPAADIVGAVSTAAAAMPSPAPNVKQTGPAKADADEPKARAADGAAAPAAQADEQPTPQAAPARDRGEEFRAALQSVAQDGARQPPQNKIEKADLPTIKPEASATPLPPLGAAAPTQDSSPASAAVHARAAVPALQVAHEIIRRFDGDTTTFELRLDPPELGRVDIRLDVARDHRVTATVAADNPQALADLVRHARDLEQTLQSAGLTLSEDGLSFDLRQGGERNADAHDANASAGGSAAEGDPKQVEPQPTSARPIGYERWRGVRLDITV